jgi:MFS family permease
MSLGGKLGLRWPGRDLPRNVVALAIVSMLSDAAGDMAAPLLPMFLATLAGGGALALGWIEGCADALSSLLKLGAGVWSDRAGARKPLVVVGYVLAALARPLMALPTAAWHVGLVRALDRTGKGLRTSPRDALIAAAVPRERHGEAFGFHRALDHTGAVLGPLLAVLFLVGFGLELRTVFWIAAVPGALSVIVLLVYVKDERTPPVPWDQRANVFARPAPELVRVLLPIALFTLGNASDLFLLMRALEALSLEHSLAALPLLWLALHVVKMFASLWGGRASDRYGPRKVITAGWLYYAAIYGALAWAEGPWTVTGLCVAYGVYHGLTEGSEKALVASLAPQARSGAAFGWYHLTVGLLALPASVGFGWLWQRFGSSTAFLSSAALALAACGLLLAICPRPRVS